MSGLGFSLRGVSESGKGLKLVIDKHKGNAISITLLGDIGGKYEQIDFESITKQDAHDLAHYLMFRSQQECSYE